MRAYVNMHRVYHGAMNKTLSRVIIAVTSLLIIVVVGRYAYMEYPALFGMTPVVEQKLAAPQLNGSLILTMRPSVPARSPAAIYAMSTQDGTLKKVDDSHDFFSPSFSTDGRVAVTAALDSTSVVLAIVKANDKTHPTYVVAPAPTLTPGASSWSPDNKYIAYEAVTALPAIDDIAIENSRIVLLDVTTGAQKILDTGASPLFVRDGSVLYVKSDGIYRIDADGLAASSSAESALRVAYFDGYQASRMSRIALSHDGVALTASHPQSNGFVAYAVSTSSPFTLTDKGGIKARVLYPVFSPDDRSIAFVELGTDADGHTTKNIMIADTRTLQAHVLSNLTKYTNDALSIGAWIK